jgi:solute carrier family 25 oxoglutarate transporter 11
MGFYSYFFSLAQSKETGGGNVPFTKKLLCGSSAGAIASIIGTPAELALVRMGADSRLPKAEQRGYKNAVDCVLRIAKEEGVVNLWRGAVPTVARATVLNACQLAIYSEAKETLVVSYPNIFTGPTSIPTMFCGSMVSAFVAIGASMPFDVIKSRMQNMPLPTDGRPPIYTSAMDCMTKSIKEEGVVVLWRGFTPAYLKLAPYTVLSFTILENLTKLLTGQEAM